MSEMGKAGLISSRRGANAGWQLAKPPEAISLRDVNDALGAEAAFAMHRNEPSANCPVARGIRPALAPVYARVDDAVSRELAATTLADVLRDTLDVDGA
jgi:DNA-binding IscR family transcriptional regulator